MASAASLPACALPDESREATAKASALLDAACAPLINLEWVRDFLIPSTRSVATDLSLLTSANGREDLATLSGFVQTTHGPGLSCCLDTSVLLIPTLSMSGYTVGLAVERDMRLGATGEGSEGLKAWADVLHPPECRRDGYEASIGRFCMSNSDGSWLMIGRLFPGESDYVVPTLGWLCGNQDAESSAILCRDRLRLVWWPPLCSRGRTDDKRLALITAVVDAELFKTGMDNHDRSCLKDSILITNVSKQETASCPWCLGRGQAAWCECQTRLTANAGVSNFRRNLKAVHCGSGSGAAELLCKYPRIPGLDAACGSTLSFTQQQSRRFGVGADELLASQLTQLAIDRSMSSAVLPRQIMPHSSVEQPPLDVDSFLLFLTDRDHPAHRESVGVDSCNGTVDNCLDFLDSVLGASSTNSNLGRVASDENSIIHELREDEEFDSFQPPVPASSKASSAAPCKQAEKINVVETAAHRRVRKNREAAARSNLARKRINDARKEALTGARRKATTLLTKERALREENIALRLQMELQRARTPRPV